MATYSTSHWAYVRRHHLTRHPHCVDCGQPADQVDHNPSRQLLAAAGIKQLDATRWLHSRCAACHSRKTAKFDSKLLKRWRNGEDATELCELALEWGAPTLGYHP